MIYRNLISCTRFVSIICWVFLFMGNSPNACAQPYIWKSVSMGAGGFVSALIPSKLNSGVMYARTDVGGAYKWNAAASEWIPLNDWAADNETGYLGVESLAIDPQTDNNVYMLVGIDYFNGGKSAILKSTDGGNSFVIAADVTAQFKAHGNGMGRQNGEKLVVDPNNSNTLFCGSRRNGLFRSTNGGATWASYSNLGAITTPNDNGISFVLIDKNGGVAGGNSQKFFLGISRAGSNNFYVSTNGGLNFNPVAGAPTTYMPQRAVLASDGNIYITYANGSGPHGHWAVPEPMDNGQVWKYNSGTGVWTNVTPGIARAYGGISVDPLNPNRLLTCTINTYMAQYNGPSGTVWGDRIFLSTNGGASWTDMVGTGITLDANGCTWINSNSIHWCGSIEFNPFNTSQAWIASGNGVFSCDNINTLPTTWKFNVKGLEETVPLDAVSIVGGPLVSVIGDYDGFIHTDVTAYSPIHTPRMGTTTGVAYAANNTNKLLRVGSQMYYSNNQGVSWTLCGSMNGSQGKVAISADGAVFLHGPNGMTNTYRSTDNGTSWTTCNGLPINGSAPAADFVNANKIYAYDNNSGAFYVSTDKGINFGSPSNPGPGGSKYIRTVPGYEGHIWMAMYGGGIRRSVNSGSSFTNPNTNVTYCAAIGLGKAAPSATYPAIYIWGTVSGVTGVFRSIDQGLTWLRINTDQQEFGGPGNGQFVFGDMNVYGRVYMSTAGRGIVFGEPAAPTPLTLIDFFATKNSSGSLSLVWRTSREEQLESYQIRKNMDGGSDVWEALVEIRARNTAQIQEYTWEDAYLQSAASYYSLWAKETDGDYYMIKIIAISSDHESAVGLYPNPAEREAWLKAAGENLAWLKILDLSGKMLEYRTSDFDRPLGAQLTSGTYLVELGFDTYTKTIRWVKQ